MMKKEKELLVAVASQKGGVGKSVFTVLLASVLHYRKGLRVAVVDCDYPQHSIALMRERDMESVMKNDDLKVSLYRQHERIRKLAYPVIKSDPEKAVEDLRRYMDEKGETFDIVLFDLPGTLRSEGVVYTVAAMDYIFVPLKADNIVMQSSLQFTKALEEELVARKNCNLKGTWLFWNMVDRRGRKDLYDAWNRVIDKMEHTDMCTMLVDNHQSGLHRRHDIFAFILIMLGRFFKGILCIRIQSQIVGDGG